MRRDRKIIERSPLYQKMAADLAVTPVKRRKTSTMTTSPSASEAPVTTFEVDTDSE